MSGSLPPGQHQQPARPVRACEGGMGRHATALSGPQQADGSRWNRSENAI
ncbi:hypothetical protein [Alicycliphilus denitrificans]